MLFLMFYGVLKQWTLNEPDRLTEEVADNVGV